ncbi:hypothetical protein RND71_025576 [Anisodus tanguticus]|uniref:Uncharacterized protein n=1 Tax=Anisodus tanguticus TaxID=243964 RepID=A0AAE1VDK2_9SOLA|nr:hypothetical protein RND71_025576 [Anisodus tanguticus]
MGTLRLLQQLVVYNSLRGQHLHNRPQVSSLISDRIEWLKKSLSLVLFEHEDSLTIEVTVIGFRVSYWLIRDTRFPFLYFIPIFFHSKIVYSK